MAQFGYELQHAGGVDSVGFLVLRSFAYPGIPGKKLL